MLRPNLAVRASGTMPRFARNGVSAAVPHKKTIWLDCDPGHDDALAMILAGHHPRSRFIGVSTVFGNHSLEKVTFNACLALQAAGLNEIEVFPGVDRPFIREPEYAPHLHGKSGLDTMDEGDTILTSADLAWDAIKQPSSQKAVFAMHDAVTALHESDPDTPVYIVCTASLTNMALFVKLYPELIPHIKVVCMGGSIGVGNIGPSVEFNFRNDPEATKIVFESGVDLTMIPLEVTHTALATEEVCQRILSQAQDSPFRRFVMGLIRYFALTYKNVYHFDDPPMHDACAVFCALHPELFKLERMRVDIETQSQLSAGQSVCDIWNQSSLPPNCFVGTKMDVGKFWDAMIQAIDSADTQSPLNKAHLSV